MEIRRKALLAVKLSQLMTPEDEYVQQMAKVLQQLLALSPGGWSRMRDKDPEEAMRAAGRDRRGDRRDHRRERGGAATIRSLHGVTSTG